jgi:hypothetical protein
LGEGVEWIQLAHWRYLVNEVINLRFLASRSWLVAR